MKFIRAIASHYRKKAIARGTSLSQLGIITKSQLIFRAMNEQERYSDFQDLIEKVEMFSLDDREILLDILKKRISEQRRLQLAQEVAEIRQDYQKGQVYFGTVDDFLAQLDNE